MRLTNRNDSQNLLKILDREKKVLLIIGRAFK